MTKEVVKFSWLDLLKAVWYFLDEKKTRYFVSNLVLFIVLFFNLVPPIFLGLIIDFFTKYQPGDPLTKFYFYVITIAVLYIVIAMVRLSSKKEIAKMSIDIRRKVRVLGFEKLLEYSIMWHGKENSGNRIQKINAGSEAMMTWAHFLSNDILPTLTGFIGIIAIFLYLDWAILIFVVVYLSLFFVIEWAHNSKMAILDDEKNKILEKTTGKYFESTTNILSIKTLGVQKSLHKNASKLEDEAKVIFGKRMDIGFRKWTLFQILNGLAMGAFLFITGYEVIHGKISIGLIFTFFAYFTRLREGAQNITKITNKLIENRSAIGRMMPIFWEESEVHFGNDKFPQKWDKIELKNIGFSYSENKSTFHIKDLNFTIKRGEKVGVVGSSGSGKSTIIKLLLGLYKIHSGEILIDGKNFYDIDHNEILKNLSIVLQDTEMFNLSLKENITLMKETSSKMLNEAILKSELEPVVERIPQGLDSLVGEKGAKLSGGERQRVGIARIIAKNSDFVIFDEATSALDSITEKKIQKNIETVFAKKTMMIIAHRLSTLRNVDRIIVFSRGVIVEEGRFNDLLKNKDSRFSKLWEMQNK